MTLMKIVLSSAIVIGLGAAAGGLWLWRTMGAPMYRPGFLPE